MKKMNKKGFTLMEMLIVIAIIAILIAIAIPTFLNALENSKIRTDEANARSLKSLIASEYMAANPGTWDSSKTYYLDEKGQKILDSADGAMAYTSKKYKENGNVSGTCTDEGVITVNCSGVPSGT